MGKRALMWADNERESHRTGLDDRALLLATREPNLTSFEPKQQGIPKHKSKTETKQYDRNRGTALVTPLRVG